MNLRMPFKLMDGKVILFIATFFCLILSSVPAQVSALSLSLGPLNIGLLQEEQRNNQLQPAPSNPAPQAPTVTQAPAALTPSPTTNSVTPTASSSPSATANGSRATVPQAAPSSSSQAPVAAAKKVGAVATPENISQARLNSTSEPKPSTGGSSLYKDKTPAGNYETYAKIGRSIALFGMLLLVIFGAQSLLGMSLSPKLGWLHV